MALQLSTALTFRPIHRRMPANPKAFLVQRNVVAQYADLKAIQARGGIGSREKLTYLSSSGNSTSSLIALPLQHHDFFGQLGSGNAFIPRASHADNAESASSVGSGGFAFVIDIIVDALLLIVRIPRMVLSLIRKEQTILAEVEEKLDKTLDIVDSTAKIIEEVAEAVDKAAEMVGTDAKATEELMHKVETTSETIKSDLDSAVGALQGTLGSDGAPVEPDSTEQQEAPPAKNPGKAETVVKLEGGHANLKMVAHRRLFTGSTAAANATNMEMNIGDPTSPGIFTPAYHSYRSSRVVPRNWSKSQALGGCLFASDLSYKRKEMGWRLLRACFMAFMITVAFQFQTLPSLRATNILSLILATSH